MTPRCTLHPGRPAGWRCRDCRRVLCPGCVVEVEVLPAAYLRCGPCGGPANILTRPGTDLTFPRALRGALVVPVALRGLFLVLALAALAGELGLTHRPPEAPPRARPEPIAVDETTSGRLELGPLAPDGQREE